MKILVVDPSGPNLSAFNRIIKSQGYTVVSTGQAQAALACVKEDKEIGLIIIDIDVGDMSFLDLIEQVQKESPAMRIIIIGASSPNCRPADLPFLRKPFGCDSLMGAILRELERAQQ